MIAKNISNHISCEIIMALSTSKLQLQKFYDTTVIVVVRQWHHAYLGSRLDSTAMFGNLWLLQHFLGFAVLHNGFSGFRLKIPDFTKNHKNSNLGTYSDIIEYHMTVLRSREYMFTHMNCSTVDIPFLSEALSGERI